MPSLSILHQYPATLSHVRGVHPDFCVKLDFEIVVEQETGARDQTFEEVVDSGHTSVPAWHPRPYVVQFWFRYAKSSKHAQN